MATAFQRARSPEQKAERTEQILGAAEAMLAEGQDVARLSLSELARRAGMAKSNVYRYFESREAILLALLEDRTERWAREVIAALRQLDSGGSNASHVDAMARVLAESATARPVMCHLMSALPSVLEHNVSLAPVRSYKASSLDLIGRLATAMHAVVPELGTELHSELLHHAFAFIVGSWPLAHPSEVAEEVLKDPALAPLRHAFAEDLRRVVGLMASGMIATLRRETT